MRIAVYGAGGMAGSMGAKLWQAGHDLAIIARGEHLKAIQQGGLQIEFRDGGGFTVKPRMTSDDPSKVGEVDLVILGVKAWQVPDAARALLPMVGPETRVMTIQNGVEAPYQVAEVVPPERVIAGVMMDGGTVTRPGVMRTTKPNSVTWDSFIGQLAPKGAGCTPAVARVQEALRGAGYRIVVPEDISTPLWTKFVPYASISGVASLCRAPAGAWRSRTETRQLMRQATLEGIAVGNAQGSTLGGEAIQFAEEFIDGVSASFFNSTTRDFLAGRPSELEAFVGAIVRLGRGAGVPTPVNDFIYAALLPQELKARGQIAWPE